MTPAQHQERRMSERVPTSIGLSVYAYGAMVARGRAVDMSEHGMRIQIERDFSGDALSPGRHLDVLLADAASERWLPLTVVRQWRDGFAGQFLGVTRRAARNRISATG